MKRHEIFALLVLAAALIFIVSGCLDLGAMDVEPSDREDESEPDPEPPQPPDAPDDLDYTGTPWALTNVSRTPGTISHHAQLALAGDHAVVAFSEPAATNFADQDIHRAVRVGDEWVTQSVTVASSAQLAFPNVVGSSDALWYAYTGPSSDAEPNSDIWVRREAIGLPLGEAINITAEAAPTRSDARSQLVARPDGSVDVLYISRPIVGDIADNDVRVIRVSADGQVSAPEPIVAPAGYCGDLIATGDAAGAVHAVADCGDLIYITNASGAWEILPVPLGASRFPATPDITIDATGAVHLVWTATVDCDDGATCRRVHHSRDLGEPIEVAGENGYMAEVAVDRQGRVLVVYHRTGDAPAVMLTHADDGRTFQPPRPIADTSDRDTSATHLQFDTRGWPHLLFQRVLGDTEPLDSEIIHATIR